MANVYQEYFGRFPLAASDCSFSVKHSNGTTNIITLTNGYYYLCGYTGEGNQLVEHMQTRIRANAAGQSSANVWFNHTQGYTQVRLTAAANIVWNSNAIPQALGMPYSNTSALANHSANAAPRYVWRPSMPAESYPVSLDNVWSATSTTQYRRSSSGAVHSVASCSPQHETEFAYQALPAADVVPTAGNPYRAFYNFFLDVIDRGRRIRLFQDKTKTTSADCSEAMWGGEDAGKLSEIMSRLFKNYQGYWRIVLPLWKWTS